MSFNLEDYEPVQDRIKKFYDKYPDGRIITVIDKMTNTGVIFKAMLFKNIEDQKALSPLSTGYAFERPGEGYVNKTSWLENCETSSIGRALANIGMHGDKRASREEMEKVQNDIQNTQ